jgi:hypothetical protein
MKNLAETRFRLVATIALGVSMVATGVADLPAIAAQREWFADWWWFPAIALNIGAALGFLVLPFVAAQTVRIVTRVYAVGSLVVLITLPLAGDMPDALGSAWPLRIISTFAVAAALAFVSRGIWAYLVALMVMALVSAWAESGDVRVALNGDLVDLSVAVPFVLLILAILRTGRALDAASASAIEAARRDAAGAASALERRRVELLAHDYILYTLRATALGFPTSALAQTSLARLSEVEAPSGADVVTRLRSLTTLLAPEGSFSARGAGEVSPTVADALVEATGEALRNSVLHSAGAAIRISLDLSPRSARVTIADDGPGFRVSRLPAGRLGVTRGIVERMHSVYNGTARIRSAPGRGTTVELGWSA